jgi:hypothetical protein
MAGFVVKATVPDGEVSWLSPPTFRGLPRLRHREAADVFETLGEAYGNGSAAQPSGTFTNELHD